MVNNQELTPLHTAVSSSTNSRDTIALLRSGADVNARASLRMVHTPLYWATPLHMATVYNRNPKVIDALLNFGSDVNAFDKKGFTPLMRATTRGDNKASKKIEIITILLNFGANVNVWNKKGDTALHLAVLHGYDTEAINILLDAGADVNALNGNGNTPLHFASQTNTHPEIIKTLIGAGAVVNIQSNDNDDDEDKFLRHTGDTPLQKAIKENTNNKIIEALLDSGADVNGRGKEGTPLHYAITTPSHNNKGRQAGWTGFLTYSNLNDFCEGCEVDVIKILLKAGADVEATDCAGNTPLSLATEKIKNKNQSVGVMQVLEVIDLLKDAEAKTTKNVTASLLQRVDEFELSVRVLSIFRNANIVYIADLVQKTESDFLRMPNSGRKSLHEIKEFLAGMSLHLGMDVIDWPPKVINNHTSCIPCK